jgi:plasmid stabilization system protein ParE
MPVRTDLTPKFKRQFIEQLDYLEHKRPGHGIAFRKQVAAVLGLVAQFPHMHALYDGDVRRVFIRKYKYHIYYTLGEGSITVLSMYHAQQEPGVHRVGDES